MSPCTEEACAHFRDLGSDRPSACVLLRPHAGRGESVLGGLARGFAVTKGQVLVTHRVPTARGCVLRVVAAGEVVCVRAGSSQTHLVPGRAESPGRPAGSGGPRHLGPSLGEASGKSVATPVT